MIRFYSAVNGSVPGKISVTHNNQAGFHSIFREAKKSGVKYACLISFALLLVMGSKNSLCAQGSDKTAPITTASAAAKEGTYQLIFNSRREDKEIKLTSKELMVIEKLRKDNEVVYARATYSDDIRVKILPRNIVNGKDFSPRPLKYFKDEESYEEYSQIRYIDLQ